MFEYASGLIAEKRARPADDLATRLLEAEVEGRRLTDPEFLLFFLLLIDAGGDTTRNLLSSGLLALQEHREQRAWLMADLDARLPAAREELLRYASPVIYMRRTATRDTEIAGTKIAAGDKVVMYFKAAANRDPRPGSTIPTAFDLARTPNERRHRLSAPVRIVSPGPASGPDRDRRHPGRGADSDARSGNPRAAGVARLDLHLGSEGDAGAVQPRQTDLTDPPGRPGASLTYGAGRQSCCRRDRRR